MAGSDVSSVTSYWATVNEDFVTTLGSTISSGAVTVPLNSTAGLTNGTIFVGVIEPGLAKQQTFTGTVDTSGSQITGVVWTRGTNASHTAGVTIEDITTGTLLNMMNTGILKQHNQDGTHKSLTSTNATLTNLTVTNLTVAGTNTTAGWNPLGHTPDTVVYNGNHSYTETYNGVNLTGTLSPGMRLQHARTIAAPTQCTSLNSTTQYYNKASPTGMTFTNNFVVSAWVKLSSYAYGTIVSRYDGTSGWAFDINASGQVRLRGMNGSSSNFSDVTSYQSIPLNKWVHVAAQLDMATFTATTTTSYAMIDAVDVPATVNRGGTNPTALVQPADDLRIGAIGGVTNFFPGKIAQVAIYNAKVTEANVIATISQGLAGTETALISAYSFNNSINDLNANANNLTANGSAVATNADSPFGGQAGGSISSTLDYGIITSASFSTNTTLVVQVPEGCTIPTSNGVSAVNYATVSTPYGFPRQRGKWQVVWLAKGVLQLIGTNNTWGTGSTTSSTAITIPIGEWVATYDFNHYFDRAAGVNAELYQSLSTSANAETDTTWSAKAMGGTGTGLTFVAAHSTRSGPLSLSAKTVYYGLFKFVSSDAAVSTHALNTGAGSLTSLITAECAYL